MGRWTVTAAIQITRYEHVSVRRRRLADTCPRLSREAMSHLRSAWHLDVGQS